MTEPKGTPSLREATLELHRYLSGELAPMMAVDSVAPFLTQPPQLAAAIITEWIEAQYQGTETPVPVSDLVFHALKKSLQSQGHSTAGGDEGGFAPNLESNEAALQAVIAGIEA